MKTDALAIVGMAGRFPGAQTPRALWDNLIAGEVSLAELPDARDAAVEPIGGTIGDPYAFDSGLYDYSYAEACEIDPQQRVFLEQAQAALEDAGCNPDRTESVIGVFAAAGKNAAQDLVPAEDWRNAYFQMLLANEKDFLAARVAYKLDLRGPALSVQSHCASSLVAVHLARQSLLAGDCDIALAGGVSLLLPPYHHLQQLAGPVSPSGACRPFDETCDGTVFSSGVGIVVLKRLPEAIAEGDYIYATVRGSAVCNDGAAKQSFSEPSASGQARTIRRALHVAGLEPNDIGLIEAHATGTPTGDPVELRALCDIFSQAAPGSVAIGSIKANVGHLDAAAGVTSLIKAAMSLKTGVIVPQASLRHARPELEFERSPFYIAREFQAWGDGRPPRVGISAFGMGGANTHLVLEAAPARPKRIRRRPHELYCLSARTPGAVDEYLERLESVIQPEYAAEQSCNFNLGRRRYESNRAVVLNDCGRLVHQVDVEPSATSGIGFVFPGNGVQFVGMGRSVYAQESVFSQALDECTRICAELADIDLLDVLFPDKTSARAEKRLAGSVHAQSSIFSIEYALARLWQFWGVQPEILLGHSLGEYAAVCIAGGLELRDAICLVMERARIMASLPRGGMSAVFASADEIAPMLGIDLVIAAYNGPSLHVVSGPLKSLVAFEAACRASDVRTKRLPVSFAAHSKKLAELCQPFAEVAKNVSHSPLESPVVSTASGDLIPTGTCLKAQHWVDHLLQPVQFGKALTSVGDCKRWLEVGPGQSMSVLLNGVEGPHHAWPSLTRVDQQASELATLQCTLGALALSGTNIDWGNYFGAIQKHPVVTYPFQREICRRSTQVDERISWSESQDMPEMPIGDRLLKAWREVLEVEEITSESRLSGCGADSLRFMRVLTRINAGTTANIPIFKFISCDTVAQQVALIEELERNAA